MGLLAMMVASFAVAVPGAQADECSRACELRVQRRVVREHKQRVVGPYRAWLRRLVWCESRGDYSINTGNGFYGAAQWTLGTWRNAGGEGMPHHATRLEQDYRTVRWRQRIGEPKQTMGWPSCG